MNAFIMRQKQQNIAVSYNSGINLYLFDNKQSQTVLI